MFFIYGLAFFCMGLAMYTESGRSPILVDRRILVPLFIFGFVHGMHEWMEMFLEKSGWISMQSPIFWGWLRVGVLIFSFICLLIFGLQALFPHRAFRGKARIKWFFGIVAYVLSVVMFGLIIWGSHHDQIAHVDIAVRYFIAVPGALLAGIALLRDANRAPGENLVQLQNPLRIAAWSFFIYGLTQIVVNSADVFPASVLNTLSFENYFGFPIQVIRAAMAVVITIALIRATRLAEEERQKRYASAQQARIDALEKLEQETSKREAMRKEMLRHIVLAQEEERARIARELHDDTSQTLTAFTFHLAALQNNMKGDREAILQLNNLQGLSRKMSSEIYRLVHDLRPAQLDDLGLVPALRSLCDESERQMGLKVGLKILGNQRRLNPLVETALYRIAQESLTNTARHSGVKQADIQFIFQDDGVLMSVSDQGIGFNPDQFINGRWGLAGMRERAEASGGNLQIRSEIGKGTEITIRYFHRQSIWAFPRVDRGDEN